MGAGDPEFHPLRWNVPKLKELNRLLNELTRSREERWGLIMAIALCESEKLGLTFEQARSAWEALFRPNVELANQQRELRKLIGYEAPENDNPSERPTEPPSAPDAAGASERELIAAAIESFAEAVAYDWAWTEDVALTVASIVRRIRADNWDPKNHAL